MQLTQGIPTPRVHAVILAGGSGHALAPLPCAACCKPLLPVRGVPMLHHALRAAARAGVCSITVVAPPGRVDEVSACVRACPDALPEARVVVVGADADAAGGGQHDDDDDDDSADALRSLLAMTDAPLVGGVKDGGHTLVISGDLVTNADLAAVVQTHIRARAACTVALSRSSIPSGPNFTPHVHVIADPSGSRLLGIVEDGELDGSMLRVRTSLLRRYPTLAVRADLKDPHVYIFAPWTLQTLLPTLPQVSSVRLDLVPYLARRQFTLSKQLQQQEPAAHGISLGQLPPDQIERDVKVALHIFPEQAYVHRLNTVKSYLSVSLDPVAGALDSPKAADEATFCDARNIKTLAQDKKKGGKSTLATILPFETVGERVHVSVDSYVGKRCSAGDRASVKRSCIGDNVMLGAGVKVSGSVVMDNVILHDGANVAGCVIGAGAAVGKGSVLKDCRVAFAMQVNDETQAIGEDLTAEKPVTLDDFEFS